MSQLYIMTRSSYIQRTDDIDIHFVPNQQAYMDVYIVLAYSPRVGMLLLSYFRALVPTP